MKSIRTFLTHWNVTYSDRTKLQHAYAALAVISLIVAGIISLINYSLGQSFLFISIVTVLVFIGNGVVWALINTFVIPSTPTRPRQSKK
ncbi:MAG TPA: hypothetical protein PKD28_03740 [Candidatus Saccharibacteria bacterium]|nr:hypothetical protein [Candidatus Saccharibacteria bacterium]